MTDILTGAARLGRSASGRSAILVAVLIVVVMAPAAALADGDPASDVLVTQNAFVSQDASTGTGELVQIRAVLGAAARAGYPIRLALIGSESDLGSVTALWQRPQSYATFLGQELSLSARAPVLVAMPDGFGLSDSGAHDAAVNRERVALARVRPAGSAAALTPAAIRAVQALASAAGHPIPSTALSPSAPAAVAGSSDVIAWLVFAIGAALIAVSWIFSVRARPLRSQ